MELPEPLLTLASADGASFGRVGYAGIEPETSKAYTAALPLVERYVREIEWMLANATPAGRFYAASLLGTRGPEAQERAWSSLVDVRDVLSLGMGGCMVMAAPLGDFAKSILACGDPLRGLPRTGPHIPGPNHRPAPPRAPERRAAPPGVLERLLDGISSLPDAFDAHRGKIALAFWIVAGAAWVVWMLSRGP